MEAIKPLVVLVLFGTILYGAYSVVQKGPTNPVEEVARPDAPPFTAAPPAAPQVELTASPVPAAPPAAPPVALAPATPAVPPAPA